MLLVVSGLVLEFTYIYRFKACFLIPLGVAIYVVAGGMRATLLCD